MTTHPPRLQSQFLAVMVTAMLLTALAAPAHAHVTADPDQAHTRFFTTSLRVTHGCEGSPTTSVEVHIPEGVQEAKPRPLAGWRTEVTAGRPAAGDAGEAGHPIVVSWSGGPLPDDHFQEFDLNLQLSDQLDGETFYLPVVQSCETGEQAWIETPANPERWRDLDNPAPRVQVAFQPSDHNPVPAQATSASSGAPRRLAADGGALMLAALGTGLLSIAVGGVALARRSRS